MSAPQDKTVLWRERLAESISEEVLREVYRAIEKFPPFNSAHEGWAVLMEEVDELWEEVKKNKNVRDKVKMRTEAIQCAAMAIRFVMDVNGENQA